MEALVIGKPNVGKSLFVINFAAYLGTKEIGPWAESPGPGRKKNVLTMEEARHKLVSPKSYRTLSPYRVEIDMGQGRQRKTFCLIDSTGISEGVHHQAEIRAAMATTLTWLMKAHLVTHLIDVAAVGSKRPEAPGPVDDEICLYAGGRGPYLLVANKTDKPDVMDNLRHVREHFSNIPVIAVSALTHQGFREIKALTLRYLDA
ncbi:MAG TPA: hypothetical protein DD856_05845 [Sulfobacillus sp.]|nr:hypothetical protein [Sulfobacillus sp.]